MQGFRSIVIIVRTSLRAIFLSGIVMIMMANPASAQPSKGVGQISGVVAIPGKGTLAGVTAQLRDLTTKQLVGVVKTNASGQFVFVVDGPGSFIVEILDEKGAVVVGTTSPIVLAPGAMIVSGVAVSPMAGGAAAAAGGAAGGAAAGQGEQGTGQGSTGAAGAMAGGVSSNIFMPTLPSVSSAATGSGVAAGTVPSRGTASPSR